MNNPRQSKDFKEVVNIQTDMNVDDLKWARIFHNWSDPENCQLAKKVTGCAVCDQLKKEKEERERHE